MAIYLITLLLLIFLALLSIAWMLSNIISMALGAPAVSSSHTDHWKDFADSEKTLLDLGCGSGSVCLRAAPYFKHVYGIEYSPFYYWLARIRTARRANVTILYGNFFSREWPKTDYIYCYLFPELLAKMKPFFLKSGAERLFSLSFTVKDWPIDAIVEKRSQKLYVYNLSALASQPK